MQSRDASWPELRYSAWKDTCESLHLWTQVVGKIRLRLAPPQNHTWHVALYVTAAGLTTSPIPCGSRTFEVQFDFHRHVLDILVSDGSSRSVELRARSVADFYRTLFAALQELRIHVSINPRPCEIAAAVPFDEDTAARAYDASAVARFAQVLRHVDGAMKEFRARFLGKSSPVHFFWGSFDLAMTRFSGRTAPAFTQSMPGMPAAVMRDAYSHEEFSVGFWPGNDDVDALFYAYVYPGADAFARAPVRPVPAHFHQKLGEFVFSYADARASADPHAQVLEFFQSCYEAAAVALRWDRSALDYSKP